MEQLKFIEKTGYLIVMPFGVATLVFTDENDTGRPHRG